jgi:hypothetical protein
MFSEKGSGKLPVSVSEVFQQKLARAAAMIPNRRAKSIVRKLLHFSDSVEMSISRNYVPLSIFEVKSEQGPRTPIKDRATPRKLLFDDLLDSCNVLVEDYTDTGCGHDYSPH